MAIAINKVSSLVTYISKYYLLQKSSSLLTNYPSILHSLEPSSSLGHKLLSTFYFEDTELCLAGRFYNFKHHKLDLANLSRKIVCYRWFRISHREKAWSRESGIFPISFSSDSAKTGYQLLLLVPCVACLLPVS